MSFDIKELNSVNQWIEQFDLVDRYAAELLLQSLNYVSFESFEKTILEKVEGLVNELQINNNTSIAIFPIRKNTGNKFNKSKEYKAANDSSGRIGHILKNLERKLQGRVEISPRVVSMSQSKVRNIIYVDDIIGSGNRFLKFWRNDVSKSIKSWVSGGYCTVWIVSHTIHQGGLTKLTNNLKAIDSSRVVCGNLIKKSSLLSNVVLKNLLIKYGARTNKPDAALGYNGDCSPVIFQYGCPNNAPAILWATGNPKVNAAGITTGRWNAIFSERSIDSSLYKLFNGDLFYKTYPELLWNAGQYKLAFSFCENLDASNDTKVYILMLALISKGYSLEKVKSVFAPINTEFNSAVSILTQYGLIDKNFCLTIFGKDVLRSNKKQRKIYVDKEYENYYPSSYLGILREI